MGDVYEIDIIVGEPRRAHRVMVESPGWPVRVPGPVPEAVERAAATANWCQYCDELGHEIGQHDVLDRGERIPPTPSRARVS